MCSVFLYNSLKNRDQIERKRRNHALDRAVVLFYGCSIEVDFAPEGWMYRDNSLMPKEAIRLTTLGTLIQDGAMRYGDLATAVRHFTERVVGPSLDLMGTSLEMLRYEGLIEALEGSGMEDNARLGITAAGRQAFEGLMRASVRASSSDDFNKLVVTLKLRFLHLLEPNVQCQQVEGLCLLYEAELTRLSDLARSHADDHGWLLPWLEHDIVQMQARLLWFRALCQKLQGKCL